MPRDAKRMKPVRMWAVVDEYGQLADHRTFVVRRLARKNIESWNGEATERIARVEIRELPPKRKRHAP